MAWEGPLSMLGQKIKNQGQIWTLNILQFVFSFLLNNSISFWYTLMILHTYIKRDPRRTSVDFDVKSQGHILTLNFVPFPHGDPISFWHTMIIWWGQEVKSVTGGSSPQPFAYYFRQPCLRRDHTFVTGGSSPQPLLIPSGNPGSIQGSSSKE